MAKLTAKQRKKIPKSEFGIPSERKYPMPDRSHAANAKARAQQQYDKGSLSKGMLSKIDSKANRILGETKGKPKAKVASKRTNQHHACVKRGGCPNKRPFSR